MSDRLLCIYYRVPVARHAELAAKLAHFQDTLERDWPGLICERLQRSDASASLETWMETYRHPDAPTPALMTSIERAAEQAGLPAPRHAEAFVALT